jgi:hypothetical protein
MGGTHVADSLPAQTLGERQILQICTMQVLTRIEPAATQKADRAPSLLRRRGRKVTAAKQIHYVPDPHPQA